MPSQKVDKYGYSFSGAPKVVCVCVIELPGLAGVLASFGAGTVRKNKRN